MRHKLSNAVFSTIGKTVRQQIRERNSLNPHVNETPRKSTSPWIRSKPLIKGQFIHPADLKQWRILSAKKLFGSKRTRLAEFLRPAVLPEHFVGAFSLDEGLMRHREAVQLQEKQQLLDDVSVYINPVCRETDKLITRCNSFDDLLGLTVSHRGVFFVQNLATSAQVLAILSVNASVTQLCALVKDERFELLLSDIRERAKSFDLVATVNILLSLRRLGLRNYLVFNALIPNITSTTHQIQDVSDMQAELKAVQAYIWSGYDSGAVFEQTARAVVEGRKFLSRQQLVQFCREFGCCKSHLVEFFSSVQNWLLNPSCPFHLENGEWTPLEVSLLCEAVTRHKRPEYDKLLTAINKHIEENISLYNDRHLITCLNGFKRANLCFPKCAVLAAQKIGQKVEKAAILRRPLEDVSVSRLCFFLDSLSHFAYDTPETRRAVVAVLRYLEDHIGETQELSALRACWTTAVYGLTSEFSYLNFFMFRKIGHKLWEKDRVRVFQLWIAQQLQFPDMDCDMPLTVLFDSYRQWCLSRGGFRTPFSEEVQELSTILLEMGVEHIIEKEIDGPLTIDIAFEKHRKALFITTQCPRNRPLEPSGLAVLQFKHMRLLGWEPMAVSRAHWITRSSQEDRKNLTIEILEKIGLCPLSLSGIIEDTNSCSF